MSDKLHALRQAIQLAKAPKAESMRQNLGYKFGPEPETYSTAPEIAKFGEGTTRIKATGNMQPQLTPEKFRDMANKATDPNNTPAFGDTFIPHSDHIVGMARLGEPAKGEYANTFGTITDLFGFHPHGVPVWLAANAAFSPNTAYPEHAAAATHFTANWLALPERQKKDPEVLRRIVDEAVRFGKLHTEELALSTRSVPGDRTSEFNPVYFRPDRSWEGLKDTTNNTYRTMRNGPNVDRLLRTVQNIEAFHNALAFPQDPVAGMGLNLMGSDGLLKVSNFAGSYTGGQIGAALDTHMNRWVFHPLINRFFSQGGILNELKRQLDPGDFNPIREATKGRIPVRSSLVRELMKHPDLRVPYGKEADGSQAWETIPGVLKSMNSQLTSNPVFYAAYKHTVADAARKLNWPVSAVQETVWTGLVSLMAANGIARDYKIPLETIHEHLNADAIRRGWQNSGFFLFAAARDAYRRAGVDPASVSRVEQRARDAAAASSRGGVLPSSVTPNLRHVATYLPGSMFTERDAAGPIRRSIMTSLKRHFADKGIDINSLAIPGRSVMQYQAGGEPLRLGQYDAVLPFQSALQRVTASNYKVFTEHMKKILAQSGIIPQEVTPAIHDVNGQARVSMFASGTYKNPGSPGTAAAWTGMLGRQPGMLSFTSNPTGQDSVYKFEHGDADAVQQVLTANGVTSRTLVPHDKAFTVYVYDQGRKLREMVGRAATQLGVPVDEWLGTGTPVGGDQKDMGRSQYRDAINASESGGRV